MTKTLEETKKTEEESTESVEEEHEDILDGIDLEDIDIGTNDDNEDDSDDADDEDPFSLKEKQDAVPLAKHIDLRNTLKGKLNKAEEENKRLREQLAAKPEPKELKRPKRSAFESDEAYESALDKYENDLIDDRFQRLSLKDRQSRQVQEQQRKVTENVDAHYSRAANLVDKSGIKPELYKNADTTVRQALDEVYPGQGDEYTDRLISFMGEGSEKVMYHLGVTPDAVAKLKTLLVQDSSGLSAAVFLGQAKEKLVNPKKTRSNAPAPAPTAKGNIGASGVAKAKKAYDAAHKKGNGQLAFDIKYKAKKAGVDTSKW